MANTAHLLINGTQYELPSNVAQDGPSGPSIQQLEKNLNALTADTMGIHILRVDIVKDGATIPLTVIGNRIVSYAAWVVERSEHVHSA